ncbi:hypothetical protein XA68_18434 [Ophiocordyceps unilateralis]|uniref:Uncharacterized protein n=1 Tax=Ophiocordyceps unilateralis TaxID=268505 RepID=A0A2A9P183_OPHUN|nr:hypothetical protein XA68_18434 [Ophiocordyceps unilateralis]
MEIFEMWLPSPRPCAWPATKIPLGLSRGLSASLPLWSLVIPPESPAYIRLPSTPQSDETRPPRVRGHLPVPRELFPRAEGDRKLQPQYIRSVVPKPANRPVACNATQQWKYVLADRRRENLGDSLGALWNRRAKSAELRNAHVNRKLQEHQRAAAAPEREDDRLTRTTILEKLLDTKVYADANRFLRAARSRTQVLAMESAKREARRHALTELYIIASNFIINEKQLDEEVDDLFREDHFTLKSRDTNRLGLAENIWGLHGKPPSIANMLRETGRPSTKLADYHEAEYARTVERHKRITEDLTGGRMP